MEEKTWEHNWVVTPIFSDIVTCSKCHNRKELYEGLSCHIPDPTEPGWKSKSIKYGCFGVPVIREKDFTKYCKKISKEIKNNPEKAKELLIRAGICTPTGRLRKPYK